MRVTAETKTRTRKELVRSARRLFETRGFEGATTRDITSAAGIALGTLFNYFPSKEALALAIIAECLEAAECEFREKRLGRESREEDIFLHIAIGLRHLRPCRKYVVAVLECTLGPLSASGAVREADELRIRHLETLRGILAKRGSEWAHAQRITGDPPSTDNSRRGTYEGASNGAVELTAVSLHLYWTLYLGVLAFWAQDESENQQDTLALLDQSTRLYMSSLSFLEGPCDLSGGRALPPALPPENDHGA